MIEIAFTEINHKWHYMIEYENNLISGMAGTLEDAELKASQSIISFNGTVHYSFNPGKPVKFFEGGNMMEMFKSGKG